MKKSLLFFVLTMSTAVAVKSQCILGAAVKAQLVSDREQAKVMTNEYLNIMPADKYSFQPQGTTRSFAQQMLHIAQVNNAMISHGTGATRIFSKQRRLELSTGAQAKDSVLYYVNASYDFAIDAIKNLDESKFEERVKERTLELTRLSWVLKAFAHQTHHRGQTTIYIRLAAIKPPNWLE